MSYAVKEIFLSLQGEGMQSGRRAIFCRFSGCNGWSGRVEDRLKGPLACSTWCDTDFVGTDGPNGGKYEAVALAAKCADLWGVDRGNRFVVLTGGEPTLQVDSLLVDVLHRWEFEIAIETNGTRVCPSGIDWITVSPKPGLELLQDHGDELKVIYPQDELKSEAYSGMDFRYRYLQPMWVDDVQERARITREAAGYCLDHPGWRLSLQAHKIIGLP